MKNEEKYYFRAYNKIPLLWIFVIGKNIKNFQNLGEYIS